MSEQLPRAKAQALIDAIPCSPSLHSRSFWPPVILRMPTDAIDPIHARFSRFPTPDHTRKPESIDKLSPLIKSRRGRFALLFHAFSRYFPALELDDIELEVVRGREDGLSNFGLRIGRATMRARPLQSYACS